ncbi:hypothetical protein CIB95_08830 [Lottiidibacillus patelloidae]|uniref:DUF218 domain-containing protein n=1 Tax=Lottiidibacillus patelloidae TaxID=2670334 RepID=A0A263BT36_9BACI|nr:YdcF family protein [Lottiidibacillus patelloidae]OZM56865.1 hypothetical protein CIB95_08830 [Lottiidibacillus patelloidae]
MDKDTIIKVPKFLISLGISIGFLATVHFDSFYLFTSIMLISMVFVFFEYKESLKNGKKLLIKKFFIISYLLLLSCFTLVSNIIFYYAYNTDSYDVSEIDAVVVLSTGLHYDITVFTLEDRLDEAIEISRENTSIPVIVSSELDTMHYLSNKDDMKHYLIERGVDSARILTTHKATSTIKNIKSATTIIKEKLQKENPTILFVTSDYHTARTILVCSKLGINGYVHQSDSYNIVGNIIFESFALVNTYFSLNFSY